MPSVSKKSIVLKDTVLSRPLTKSRFKLACECPTKLYYDDRPKEYGNDKREDPFLRNLARGGFQVGALAKLYFPGGTEITTLDYGEALSQTNVLLNQDSVTIFEAAFQYKCLFIRADIVRKEGNTLYLYEAKAKSFNPDEDSFWQKRKSDHLSNDWKEYLYDVAFQHYVIAHSKNEFRVVPHLFLANKKAIATVDGLNQKFRLIVENGRERVFYDKSLTQADLGEKLLKEVEVTREVESIQTGKPNGDDPADWPQEFSFESWIDHISEIYQLDQQIPPKVTGQCKYCEFRIDKEEHPGKASGFEECWTKALNLSPGTFSNRIPIFEIWKLTAPQFLGQGTYFIDQLSEEDFIPKTKPKKNPPPGLTTSQRKALQWERTLLDKHWPFFDKENFIAETRNYPSPLHFIDFETAMVAIPFNKGRRPYEQIAFQFSHHVLDKNSGIVEHRSEWISTERGKFPNFDFVRALKRELESDKGTIFRYHNHENTVLCQIRNQLLAIPLGEVPDRDELVSWIQSIAVPTENTPDPWEPSRPMIDLFELVQRFFWHPRMKGSNSIKVVLPAILEFSKFLQEKYSKPIYGAENGIKSRNYRDYIWVRQENGKIEDPYKLLPTVFDEWDRNTLDRLYGDEELADGGAAMMAYAKMQFSEMGDKEREQIKSALLRYCELDTLAMVMLWEGWNHA